MTGTRVEPKDGVLWLKEGEYGKNTHDGVWYCRPPGHHTGSLASHDVTEHDDGTITVSPSILITEHNAGQPVSWHGYLERGVWREV